LRANKRAGYAVQSGIGWTPSLLSVTTCFGVPEDFPKTRLQTRTDALKCAELKIFLSALDSAVVRAVHGNVVREALLTETGVDPPLTEGFAKALRKGCGHAVTLGTCLFKLYSFKGGLPLCSIMSCATTKRGGSDDAVHEER
jgi:hypothetical protein